MGCFQWKKPNSGEKFNLMESKWKSFDWWEIWYIFVRNPMRRFQFSVNRIMWLFLSMIPFPKKCGIVIHGWWFKGNNANTHKNELISAIIIHINVPRRKVTSPGRSRSDYPPKSMNLLDIWMRHKLCECEHLREKIFGRRDSNAKSFEANHSPRPSGWNFKSILIEIVLQGSGGSKATFRKWIHRIEQIWFA